MPQLEAWEQVFVSDEEFPTSTHGQVGCVNCHGGVAGSTDMEEAHTGVAVDPDPATTCAECHEQTTTDHAGSLHNTLVGYTTVLLERSGTDELSPGLTEAYGNHCASCHASCGQCHVSRPTSAGGGLLAGHTFKETPPMNLTCTGCHGSRIDNEYKGKNEMADGGTYPADVHYNPGGMACFTCHTNDDMHGVGPEQDHRYDGAQDPACTDCHPGLEGANDQHTSWHLESVSCQVCHSVAYKNCYSCHVQKSDDGVPYFQTDESQMLFYIGNNVEMTDDRPWSWVPVRHVPIDPESFEYYGEDLLPNFDARPTWTYATPHNIQLSTPQNSSCDACHGNAAIFLTEDKVNPAELEANQDVVVTDVP
ncbi:MAG: hypothetical protein ACN4GK_07870 [Acidimicrobiia bacterium]